MYEKCPILNTTFIYVNCFGSIFKVLSKYKKKKLMKKKIVDIIFYFFKHEPNKCNGKKPEKHAPHKNQQITYLCIKKF